MKQSTPTSKHVLVSVINWNNINDTISCIKSIINSTYKNYDILAIDNASTDGAVSSIKALFPDVNLIINSKNHGFSGGHNQAIKYASNNNYDLIWILNSDTSFDHTTLGTLVDALDNDASAGMVSPVIINDDEVGAIQFCGCELDLTDLRVKHFTVLKDAVISSAERPLNFCLWGTAILARTSVLAKIGGFDDSYFAYYEDLDLSIKVTKEGFKNIISPKATIRHKGINDPDDRPAHYAYYNTRNRFIFLYKHTTRPNRLRLILDHTAGALIFASTWRKKGNLEKQNAVLQAIWDGLLQRGGAWNKSSPPLILLLLVRYPYFIARILRSDLLGLFPSTTH